MGARVSGVPMTNNERQKKHRAKLKAANAPRKKNIDTLIRDHDRMRDSEIPELRSQLQLLRAEREALLAKTAALELELAASKDLVSILELHLPETPIATSDF